MRAFVTGSTGLLGYNLVRELLALTVLGVRTAAANLAVSSSLAERELGVRFGRLEETLRDSVALAPGAAGLA